MYINENNVRKAEKMTGTFQLYIQWELLVKFSHHNLKNLQEL